MTRENFYRSCLAILLILSADVMAGGRPATVAVGSVHEWPTRLCEGHSAWLEFAGLRFCGSKDEIAQVTVLDLGIPSMALRLRLPGRETHRIAVSRLSGRQVTGGLHEGRGLSVEEFLEALAAGDCKTLNLSEARAVLGLGSDGLVMRFVGERANAFALLRPGQAFSEIYLIHPGRPAVIQIAGEFDQGMVAPLLERLAW